MVADRDGVLISTRRPQAPWQAVAAHALGAQGPPPVPRASAVAEGWAGRPGWR